MREPLDLQATQTLFWQLIMAPKGVEAGAAGGTPAYVTVRHHLAVLDLVAGLAVVAGP